MSVWWCRQLYKIAECSASSCSFRLIEWNRVMRLVLIKLQMTTDRVRSPRIELCLEGWKLQIETVRRKVESWKSNAGNCHTVVLTNIQLSQLFDSRHVVYVRQSHNCNHCKRSQKLLSSEKLYVPCDCRILVAKAIEIITVSGACQCQVSCLLHQRTSKCSISHHTLCLRQLAYKRNAWNFSPRQIEIPWINSVVESKVGVNDSIEFDCLGAQVRRPQV
jgi:hypothetical protein